jgi:hypothetical protein
MRQSEGVDAIGVKEEAVFPVKAYIHDLSCYSSRIVYHLDT